jgi:hypothetical protein
MTLGIFLPSLSPSPATLFGAAKKKTTNSKATSKAKAKKSAPAAKKPPEAPPQAPLAKAAT